MTNKRLSTVFARSPRHNYLPDEDRYLSAMEPPKYKVSLIGCGMIGLEHIGVTHLEGRASVKGVYDPNPRSVAVAQQRHAKFSDTPLHEYESISAVANDPEIDGIIVCTPNFSHIDVMRQIAGCGKHVLLEKPMATTIPDAAEILKMEADWEGVFQVGLQYRYKAMYAEAKYEALVRKSAGNIKNLNLIKHRPPFMDKVNQWNKFSKFSGGTLVEKCCHYFDIFNMLAQSRPKRIFGAGSQAVAYTEFEYNGEKSDIIDNAFVHIEYENGIQAGFQICMYPPCFQEDLTICGDEGRIRAYIENNFMPNSGSKTQLEVMRGELEPSRVSQPDYPATILASGHNGASFYERVNFMNKIEGKESTAATAEEGFWSVVVGAAANEAIKSGRVIEVAELLKEHNVQM